jgi:hypothetical protein
MQKAQAVFAAGNRNRYAIVKVEHTVLGNSGPDLSFNRFDKAFLAQPLPRIRSMEKGVSPPAIAAHGSARACQFCVIILITRMTK